MYEIINRVQPGSAITDRLLNPIVHASRRSSRFNGTNGRVINTESFQSFAQPFPWVQEWVEILVEQNTNGVYDIQRIYYDQPNDEWAVDTQIWTLDVRPFATTATVGRLTQGDRIAAFWMQQANRFVPCAPILMRPLVRFTLDNVLTTGAISALGTIRAHYGVGMTTRTAVGQTFLNLLKGDNISYVFEGAKDNAGLAIWSGVDAGVTEWQIIQMQCP